jgi:hypothetical protein
MSVVMAGASKVYPMTPRGSQNDRVGEPVGGPVEAEPLRVDHVCGSGLAFWSGLALRALFTHRTRRSGGRLGPSGGISLPTRDLVPRTIGNEEPLDVVSATFPCGAIVVE